MRTFGISKDIVVKDKFFEYISDTIVCLSIFCRNKGSARVPLLFGSAAGLGSFAKT
jgi:hypothetical protein